MYWTLGQHDQVCIFGAPNDEMAASVLLAADMLGNIRSGSTRAFTTSEMETILSKMPLTRSTARLAAAAETRAASIREFPFPNMVNR